MRGTHQGQQSARTASTGRTHDCKRHLHHAPHDLLRGGGHPHMKRRDLLFATVMVAATGWPAIAQEMPKRARIGLMTAGTAFPRRYFDEAMARLGWIEGRNLTVHKVEGTSS